MQALPREHSDRGNAWQAQTSVARLARFRICKLKPQIRNVSEIAKRSGSDFAQRENLQIIIRRIDMAHPIEGIMGISMDKIREMVDVNTIIGNPIVSEGTTIIPVSKVSFGFASGGSDLPAQTAEKFAGGSGAGVTVKPVAFIVIKADGDVELLELGNTKTSPLEGVIDSIPGILEKIKGMAADKKATKESKKADKSEENDKDKKAEIGGE